MSDNQQVEQGKRLKKFRQFLNLTQQSLSENVGMDRAYYAQMENGSQSISYSTLQKVVLNYNSLNLNWLLSGNGDMLLSNTNIYTPEITPLSSLRRRVYHLPNATAWAGDVIHIAEQLEEIEEWAIPRLGIGGGASPLYSFTVQGNSMEPTLRAGDLLVCEPPLGAVADLEPGAIYVVVYPDGVRCKRLHRTGDLRGVVLRSDNPTYRDEVLLEGSFGALRVRYRITDVYGFF